MPRLCGLLLLFPIAAVIAQPATPTVQATGSATIAANPDQAQIDIGVLTSATTAQEATQQNATQTTTVLNALKSVLGTAGMIQTVAYSVYPRYNTNSSAIVGYTASNNLRVTVTDLSLIGRLIDAANQAGANSVGSLNFGLQNSEPVIQQALSQATRAAISHANAIASGLSAKTGAIVSAQENASYSPVLVGGPGTTAVATPVQTGTVNVYASVTLQMQLLP